ncbi:hypothetical protein OROHE_026032 [Orobanche hederae]
MADKLTRPITIDITSLKHFINQEIMSNNNLRILRAMNVLEHFEGIHYLEDRKVAIAHYLLIKMLQTGVGPSGSQYREVSWTEFKGIFFCFLFIFPVF